MDIGAQPRNRLSGIISFFYRANTHVALIRRLVGFLWLAPSFLGIFFFNRAQPYFVPAWRLGTHFIPVPQLSPAVCMFMLGTCAICGLLLLCGKTSKIFLAIPAVLMAFLGTCEYTYILPSYFILIWLYTVALLFYREPCSFTRIIIQLSIASCYFFSVLQKLDPEWLNGSTFYQIVAHGWVLRPQFAFITHLGIGHEAAQIFAIATVGVELFLSFALFFKRTRNSALIVGILLHIAMAVLFLNVDFFTATMLVGYLAFVDRHQSQPVLPPPIRFKAVAPMVVLILLMLWMPLRFYFMSDIPIAYLSFSDRVPWSFAMFLFHEELQTVDAKYLDADNRWNTIPLSGRMNNARSNSELYALAKYIQQEHPEAQQISVTSNLTMNDHWTIVKQCIIVCHSGHSACQLAVISRRPESTWQGLARGSDSLR